MLSSRRSYNDNDDPNSGPGPTTSVTTDCPNYFAPPVTSASDDSWHGGMHEFDADEPQQPAVWHAEDLRRLLATQQPPVAPSEPVSPTPSICDTSSDIGMPDHDEHFSMDPRTWNAGERRTLIECGQGFALHESILADSALEYRQSTRVGSPQRSRSAGPRLQTPRLSTPAPEPASDNEAVADRLLEQLDALQEMLQKQALDTVGALVDEQAALNEILEHAEAEMAAADALADAVVAAMTMPLLRADHDVISPEDEQDLAGTAATGEPDEDDWEVVETAVPSMENGRSWRRWFMGR